MASDENTVKDDTLRAGPGTQLRTARESKQISLEDISTRTNISVSKLQALEENRFDVLGPEPFVIGYIRKFAKILDMESDSLVEDYRRQAGSPQGEGETSTTADGRAGGPGPATIAGRNLVQAVRSISVWWIVAALVVIWIGGVYFLVPEKDHRVPSLHEALKEEPLDERPLEETQALPELPAGEAASENIGIATESGGTVAAQPGEDTDTPAETGRAATAPGPSPETADAGKPSSQELSSRESSTRELSNTPVDQEGKDLLVMSFTDDCWVEVRDADDQLIFGALQTPADTLQLFGKAPFSVMLGNARAASLAINGRPVDTQPRPGRNTLRLTVSP